MTAIMYKIFKVFQTATDVLVLHELKSLETTGLDYSEQISF
jgi:hypothetical protein